MATSSDAGVPKPTEAGLTHWEIAGEFKGEGGYMNQWKGTTMRKDLKRLFVKDDAMQPSHVIDKLVCVGLGSLSFRSSYRPHDEALRKRSFWQLACFMDLTTLLKDLEEQSKIRIVDKPIHIVQDPGFNDSDKIFLKDTLKLEVVDVSAKEDAWSCIDGRTLLYAIGYDELDMPMSLVLTEEPSRARNRVSRTTIYPGYDLSKGMFHLKEQPAVLFCENLGWWHEHACPILESHTAHRFPYVNSKASTQEDRFKKGQAFFRKYVYIKK